jgi:hypothetical protein
VVRLEGTNADKAKVIIQNSGMGDQLQMADSLHDAARKAVAAAKEQTMELAATRMAAAADHPAGSSGPIKRGGKKSARKPAPARKRAKAPSRRGRR